MLKILKMEEKEVRMEIEEEDHTLLVSLVSRMLEDENVDLATYSIKHPQISNPILYVKMVKGNPLDAIRQAAASLALQFEEFETKYKDAAEAAIV